MEWWKGLDEVSWRTRFFLLALSVGALVVGVVARTHDNESLAAVSIALCVLLALIAWRVGRAAASRSQRRVQDRSAEARKPHSPSERNGYPKAGLTQDIVVLFVERWRRLGIRGCTLHLLYPKVETEDSVGTPLGKVYATSEIFEKLQGVPGRYRMTYSRLISLTGGVRCEDIEYLGEYVVGDNPGFARGVSL